MKKTYVFAGISILLWSTLATVSKLLLDTMDSLWVLGISAGCAFAVLFFYNLCTGRLKVMKGYKGKDYLTLVLIGLPGTFFYNLFYLGGAEVLPASQAFIVNYLWPIMSVVFACVLLKEKLTGRKALAFVISFLVLFRFPAFAYLRRFVLRAVVMLRLCLTLCGFLSV